jgi:hypothetical protein
MPESTRPKSIRKAPKRSDSNRPGHLRLYLYAVEGTLRDERRGFQVVCCHASDARAMIAQRLPEIANLRVARGKPVHFIAVGDHLLHE